MNHKTDQNNIKKLILDKIKNRDIKKIPRLLFYLRGLMFVLVIVIISIFLIFVVSFIYFSLQVSELWYLPIFGPTGTGLLINSLPWPLIILIIILIIVLEIIFRRYSFIYRRPLLYSILLLSLILVVVGVFVRQTSLHEKIYLEARKSNVGPLKSFYDDYTKPNSAYYYPGTVIEITERGFVIDQKERGKIPVIISDRTKMRPNFKIYKGGRLLIIGKMVNGVVEADMIDNAPPNGRPQ